MKEHPTVEETFGLESEELARKICDLRYDEAERLFRDVSDGYIEDSVADSKQGNPVLTELLHKLAMQMHSTALRAQIVWRLCKPHMK